MIPINCQAIWTTWSFLNPTITTQFNADLFQCHWLKNFWGTLVHPPGSDTCRDRAVRMLLLIRIRIRPARRHSTDKMAESTGRKWGRKQKHWRAILAADARPVELLKTSSSKDKTWVIGLFKTHLRGWHLRYADKLCSVPARWQNVCQAVCVG